MTANVQIIECDGVPEYVVIRRQFIENPPNKRIPQQLWDMVDKLLLEKIPIAGISRVNEISEPWLQQYINQKYEHVP